MPHPAAARTEAKEAEAMHRTAARMSPSRNSRERYACGRFVSSALARRERKNKETMGVSSAIAAIPNKRNVTSTPSDDELGLYPHFTARIFPRFAISSSDYGSFRHASNEVMHAACAPMQSALVGCEHMPVGGPGFIGSTEMSSNQKFRAC